MLFISCILVIILFLLIFRKFFYKSNKKNLKENFRISKNNETEFDQEIKLVNEQNWNTYEMMVVNKKNLNDSLSEEKYVMKDQKNNIKFLIKIKNNIYSIYDQNEKYTGIRVHQPNIENPSVFGKMRKTVLEINYNRGYKRIKIDIGNGSDTIIGYGQFGGESKYPYPWYLVFPLVFKESGSTIAINYTNSNFKNEYQNAPSELNIIKTEEKYLPILFLVYVILQKYITFLNI